jgi:hypothetical protein
LFLVCPTQSSRDCKELFYVALSTTKFIEQKMQSRQEIKKMENLEKELICPYKTHTEHST